MYSIKKKKLLLLNAELYLFFNRYLQSSSIESIITNVYEYNKYRPLILLRGVFAFQTADRIRPI